MPVSTRKAAWAESSLPRSQVNDRRDVSHGEGEAELPARVAALVTDQVDLHKARTVLVVIGPGPHRYPRLQQRPRLGMAAALEDQRGPGSGQPAVDGRRGHGDQQDRGVIIDVQLAMAAATIDRRLAAARST